MFVKVRYPNGDDVTHECSRCQTRNMPMDIIVFRLDGHTSIEIDKRSRTEVYVMNDQGQTIDTYRWSFVEDDILSKEAVE